MCLETIESIERKPHAKGKGWKVFEVNDDGSLESEVERGLRLVGTWLMSDGHFDNYPLGFHVFTNRRAAVKWDKAYNNNHCSPPRSAVIKKVLWRDRLAIGRQPCWFTNNDILLPGKTIVAKEMMILA